MLLHEGEVFHGFVVPELQDHFFRVIVLYSAVVLYNFVGGHKVLNWLLEHTLAMVQYIHYYVLLYYLPCLSVAQNGVPYLWTNQILNDGSKLSLILPTHQ